MFIGVYAVFVCLLTLIHPSVTWSRNRSRPINGSYARSSNANNVALSTMPNVIVDFDLITWDVWLLSLPSLLLISNSFSLFLLTDVYLVIIVFSEQSWLWMVSVWRRNAVPCLHAATLHVVFRILAILSRCWFGCVFSQAGWLLYNDSPSEIALKEIPVDHMPIICNLLRLLFPTRTMFTENEYIF